MLVLGASWLANVSLGKLIVLIIGAIIIVPVVVAMLVGLLLGAIALLGSLGGGLPPWAPEEAWRHLRTQEARNARGLPYLLALAVTALFEGAALIIGVAFWQPLDGVKVAALVLASGGAGLLVSWLMPTPGARGTAQNGDSDDLPS